MGLDGMTQLVAGIVLAAGVLVLVLEPLVRGRRSLVAPAVSSPEDGNFDFTDVEESESPKVQALLAIKEIEFDRETGKLSEEDYSSLKARYREAALAAMLREEAEPVDTDGSHDAICPACGPRPESTAKYCSDCGRAVEIVAESSRCGECGIPAPPGAKFCGECGARL